ncbi:MAG TPA: hypothetical protein VGO58_14810 [Chitinophagaceae bacterium]|nr:hypothetical protein [Chitinophagaceae bacterium]
MNRLYFLLVLVLAISCSDKEEVAPPAPPSHPAMKYTELNGREVNFTQSQVLDVDNDGVNDFVFYVLPIGDPIFKQDKMRFLLGSLEHTLLFVDGTDNSSPILNKGAAISISNQLPFEWWEVSEVFLAEKITENDNSFHWEGAWKNASHQYISIQVKKNNLRYNGWVELSFDTAGQKLLLHKSGISLVGEREVKAGF